MGEERGSAIWGLVEQPGAGGGDVRMSLANAEGGPGGGGANGNGGNGSGPGGGEGGDGDLKTSKNAWTRAAGDVDAMRGNIKTALTGLEKDQAGLGAGPGTGSIQSAAAQRDVYASWKRYLGDVSARCDTLQDRLNKAGTDHYANETATKGAFDQLKGRYEDTPAVGGGGDQKQGG
ncbi:hypothetical protein DVA86_33255 [Streptomyces armeniacus]|uniref:Uncharacterized protein n=2 Tax=Streptomyces armeniacus TaxID=83291 RepID=A0A345XYJ1_9ACTN|nr:hypothetical protein DVA86_33255 [Streptomyces armeniacus]